MRSKPYLAILLLLLSGCLVPMPDKKVDPDIPPAPNFSDEQITHDATVAYSTLVAEAYESCAKKMESGDIKTDQQANEFMLAATIAARKAAFAAVDNELNRAFKVDPKVPNSGWDTGKAIVKFRGFAAGHRKVK